MQPTQPSIKARGQTQAVPCQMSNVGNALDRHGGDLQHFRCGHHGAEHCGDERAAKRIRCADACRRVHEVDVQLCFARRARGLRVCRRQGCSRRLYARDGWRTHSLGGNCWYPSNYWCSTSGSASGSSCCSSTTTTSTGSTSTSTSHSRCTPAVALANHFDAQASQSLAALDKLLSDNAQARPTRWAVPVNRTAARL